MTENQLQHKCYAESSFNLYVEQLTEHIFSCDDFGFSQIPISVIKNNWQQYVKYDVATRDRILAHAREFITNVPKNIIYRKNYLESLTYRMTQYLTPYIMRDKNITTHAQATDFLTRELFDRCTAVRRVKEQHKKLERCQKRADERAKAQESAAQTAFVQVRALRHRTTIFNGKRYERVID